MTPSWRIIALQSSRTIRRVHVESKIDVSETCCVSTFGIQVQDQVTSQLTVRFGVEPPVGFTALI